MNETGRDPVLVVGLAAGLSGFLLGLGHGAWQVSVESGQALAGLVAYPPTNPFYLYHLKLWTIVNQLSAAMLKAGLSETAASYVVSGLLGAVSFAALALVVFAFTRERAPALLVPFFIHLTPAPQYGVSYPIWLLGVSHTYGVLGLSYDLLVLAVLGCGRFRAGLVLLGLAPAVHPSLAVWLWIIVASIVAVDGATRRTLFAHKRFFFAGLTITGLSLLVQLPGILSVPKPTEDVTPYVDAFVQIWDGHRQSVDFGNRGVFVSLTTGLMAVVWLRLFARDVPDEARLLLKAFASASAIAGFLIVVTAGHTAALPRALLVLMPNRLLNINVLASAAALVALLWIYRRSIAGAAGLLILLTGLVAAYRSRYLVFLREAAGLQVGHSRFDRLDVLLVAALLLLAAAVSRRRSRTDNILPWRVTAPITVALLASAPLVSYGLAVLQRSELRIGVHNRVFIELARGEGLVATASDIHLVQLRTRRPVLLDGGGLDLLPYVSEVAPEMTRILRGVYRIDLFDPPAAARGTSMIPVEHNRTVWQERTHAEWLDVRRDFGVRDVLTPRDWDLALPLIARSKDYLLYRIPDRVGQTSQRIGHNGTAERPDRGGNPTVSTASQWGLKLAAHATRLTLTWGAHEKSLVTRRRIRFGSRDAWRRLRGRSRGRHPVRRAGPAAAQGAHL